MPHMTIPNPVIPGFYPDPSVCRTGDDFYLVTSSFEYFPGVPIFHSRDLVHWRQIGHCLTRDSQLPLADARPSSGIWAPTIRHHAGQFFMVTTNMVARKSFFVTADDPAGPWSEPVWLDQEGIDPSLLFDDDGVVYLTTSGNLQSTINPATGARTSDIRRVWPEGSGGGYLEAPHLYRIGAYYYLLVAEGGTGRGHMASIARATSPWGPFEPCSRNPILSNRSAGGNPLQATGHGDLVQAGDGSWWMVFLAIREKAGPFPRVHNLGRETFLAPVTWDGDGWPVVAGDGIVRLGMEADCLPPHPWPEEPARDDFDGPAVGHTWNFLRNPDPQVWSLAENRGHLRLRANALSLGDVGSLAFVGRRQQHDAFSAAALMRFSPTVEGQEAGLVVRINERHHYEIAVRREDREPRVVVRRRIGDLETIVARVPVSLGDPNPIARKERTDGVRLEIRGDRDAYAFLFAVGDGPATELARGETRYLSTEVAGGFTGVYIGMYAAGPGAVADFDWFEYRPA